MFSYRHFVELCHGQSLKRGGPDEQFLKTFVEGVESILAAENTSLEARLRIEDYGEPLRWSVATVLN